MAHHRRGRRLLRPQIDHLDDRCLLSGFTPAQIASAYGLSGITFTDSKGAKVTGDGTGVTTALIEAYHDPNLASDLHTFDQAYSLPDPTLKVVNQAGSQTDTGWSQEESLDVEWAHALAPGANILVVEASSQSLQDMFAAVDTARNTPGVVAVSMSWGYNEMSNEASYDSHFTTPTTHVDSYNRLEGITFIAASGDSGQMAGSCYPAASPNVLAVGGTTLTLSASGGYGSETAWDGSGGGYSLFEAEPSYQAGIQTTGQRATPDVAFDADPSTGVSVYVTLPTNRGGSQGTWMTVGGTSLGAPAWAAIIAIADQCRAVAGAPSLDGPTQTLPTLYSWKLPSTDFHTVAATSSGYVGGFGGFRFGAGGLSSWFYGSLSSQQSTTSSSGANTATGLGSPNGSALINDLAASTVSVQMTFVPGTGSAGTTSTPTAPTNPGSFGHHHRHSQSGTRTTGHTHKTGSTTVRKTPNQSSTSHLTTVRHRSIVQLGLARDLMRL